MTETELMNRTLEMFRLCTVRNEGNGFFRIECKLGLWGIEAPSRSEALKEAFRYWFQYLGDGEYDQLLNLAAAPVSDGIQPPQPLR
jgi:hypothetical protein